MAGALNMFLEKVLRNLNVDSRAVAGLAVGVDRAAVPEDLQRLDRAQHDLAPWPAVDGNDHADAAIRSLGPGQIHSLSRQALGVFAVPGNPAFGVRDHDRTPLIRGPRPGRRRGLWI